MVHSVIPNPRVLLPGSRSAAACVPKSLELGCVLGEAALEFFLFQFCMLAAGDIANDENHAGGRSHCIPDELTVYFNVEGASIHTAPAIFGRARYGALTLSTD